MKILDVGCWGGKKVQRLLKEGHDAYGCDIITSRFIPELKDRLFFLDITKKIPEHLKNSFDVIYLEEVLEHLNEGKDVVALKNIRELLKEGGALVLTTPKSIPCFEFWDPAWVRWKLGFGERHYHYTYKELMAKVNSAGFYFHKMVSHGGFCWLFSRWFNAITRTNIFEASPFVLGYFDWWVAVGK